ncbi:MAG: tetratricopeptide repeat protein [Bacteroidota bacterium]
MAEMSAADTLPRPPHIQTGDVEADRLLAEAWDAIPDRPHDVLAISREAIARTEAMGLEAASALAQGYLGFGYHLLSRPDDALPLLTEALSRLEAAGDLHGRGYVLSALSTVYIGMGHVDEALDVALSSLQVLRAAGDRELEAWTLISIGNTYLDLADPDRAMDVAEQALAVFGSMTMPVGQARAHTVIGCALARDDRPEEARAHHEAALRLARETGSRLTEARALHDLGDAARGAGDLDTALDLFHQSLAIRRDLGSRAAQSTSLLHIGQVLGEKGDTEAALDTLREARQIAEDLGAGLRMEQVDRAFASVYERLGDAPEALRYLRRAQDLREAFLDAQARSRVHVIQVRAEAAQARQEAEIAHLRSVELAEANRELETALGNLRRTQSRLLQQEKLASLGRLASGVAHEIQNPLNFVAGFAEVNEEYARELRETVEARREEMPDDLATEVDEMLGELVQNIGRVRENAQRASGIVRSLLAHGQPASASQEVVDLRDLVGRVVNVTLAGSGIRPVWMPGEEPLRVEANPQSLDRALVNLVDNARRAVTDRLAEDDTFRPFVCLSLDRVDGQAVLRVMDNGPGVPEEIRDRIFEPFFSTRPTGEGTGLGLPLALQIVTDGHGGDLTLDETEAGAAFTIRLPLVEADDP